MATVMALIEVSTLEGDDQKMETGINSLDKCSQISKSKSLQKKFVFANLVIF